MAALFRMNCVHGLRRGLALAARKDTTCRRITTTTSRYDKEETQLVKKKWVSYGYSDEDEAEDVHSLHQTMFITVTICFVFGAAVVAYFPDMTQVDWAQREAYLQLRHREEHGLPLIDPNVVDPSKIKLPSDEELGDMDIII
ncbi:NADH dehydrogenase [ubiquinone] 1 beta subcomplex subunit 11, mitochondrial [Harpegnathos saltator]|uniref:NADH dehydrogenase [ubiquinone] 1 beta subcomplex subunit 11, mitochondrial n=1 Tax=Harpegnathos saltator TaxID=610380 RepID=E2BBS0_HARSA|nr:NADH dehydrogenase [ubiquinone] 1 beta subcomplex subunit 11, mitochondrial [Harpegnathos saltator]EFN86846.1 NADH dehydrogenase [ubiquinone] 1 beta subcomplex subunit 11, mitochondrial [Harpegnathos saltator]